MICAILPYKEETVEDTDFFRQSVVGREEDISNDYFFFIYFILFHFAMAFVCVSLCNFTLEFNKDKINDQERKNVQK